MNLKNNQILNNNNLVNLWGTEKQKEVYLKNKKLQTCTKNSILKKAERFCKLEYLLDGKYIVKEVYDEEININVLKILKNNSHSLLAPIIINNLIKSKIDNEYMLNLSLINYYSLINLVHKNNYNNIRYNPKYSSKILDMEIKSIDTYFKISNEKLSYYLESCLELLEKAYIIKYYKIPFVKIRNIEIVNKHSSVITKVKNEHRRALEEEIRYVEDMITYLCNKHNIKRENFIRIFFTPNLNNIKKEYQDLLIQKNIIYYYEGYEVYYTDIKKSENFMKNFKEFNLNNYIKDFIIFMSNSIKNSINSRFENVDDKDIKFLNDNVLDYTQKTLEIYPSLSSNTTGEYHNYENEILESEN